MGRQLRHWLRRDRRLLWRPCAICMRHRPRILERAEQGHLSVCIRIGTDGKAGVARRRPVGVLQRANRAQPMARHGPLNLQQRHRVSSRLLEECNLSECRSQLVSIRSCIRLFIRQLPRHESFCLCMHRVPRFGRGCVGGRKSTPRMRLQQDLNRLEVPHFRRNHEGVHALRILGIFCAMVDKELQHARISAPRSVQKRR